MLIITLQSSEDVKDFRVYLTSLSSAAALAGGCRTLWLRLAEPLTVLL